MAVYKDRRPEHVLYCLAIYLFDYLVIHYSERAVLWENSTFAYSR